MGNKNIGSNLDDFLKEEGILEEVESKAITRIGTFVDKSKAKIEDGPGSKISAFPPGWLHSEERKTSDAVKILHKRYIGKSIRRRLRLIFYRVLSRIEQIIYNITHIN
jgi:hypothetical protein